MGEGGVARELVVTSEFWSVVIEVVLRDNIIRTSHVPRLTRLRGMTDVEFDAKKHACSFYNIIESCVFTLVTSIISGTL